GAAWLSGLNEVVRHWQLESFLACHPNQQFCGFVTESHGATANTIHIFAIRGFIWSALTYANLVGNKRSGTVWLLAQVSPTPNDSVRNTTENSRHRMLKS